MRKIMYEVINDGAVVVTRDENNELILGFYHDVLDANDDIMRIFESISSVNNLTIEKLLEYIKWAR